MAPKATRLIENVGLISKIAVLDNDYYSMATIDDLFIFSGTDPSWPEETQKYTGIGPEKLKRCYPY